MHTPINDSYSDFLNVIEEVRVLSMWDRFAPTDPGRLSAEGTRKGIGLLRFKVSANSADCW